MVDIDPKFLSVGNRWMLPMIVASVDRMSCIGRIVQFGTMVVLLVISGTTVAYAQDTQGKEARQNQDQTVSTGDMAAKRVDTQNALQPDRQQQDAISRDLEEAWSDQESMPALIPVSQISHKNRLLFLLSFGIIPNEPYVIQYPVSLFMAYHFIECLGVGMDLSYHGLHHSSELEVFVTEHGKKKWDYDLAHAQFSLLAVFTPVYAKSSLAGLIFEHFTASLYAGPALFLVEEDSDLVAHPGGWMGMNFKLYLKRWFLIQFDFIQFDMKLGLYDAKYDFHTPVSFEFGFGTFTYELF